MDLGTASEIATIVGAVLALSGVAFGGVKLVARLGGRRARHDVHVKLSWGLTTWQPDKPVIIVSAANHGDQIVGLTSVGVTLPNGHNMFFPDVKFPTRLPHDLQPGRKCQVFIPVTGIAAGLRQDGYGDGVNLRGMYIDELDHRYVSKPLKVSVSGWAE